jgi:hypothetical protein
VITDDAALVDEAVRLFEADTLRQPHPPEIEKFVVSPINSRQRLTDFILGAEKELLIYDGKLSDAEMIGRLETLVRAGGAIKVIGEMSKRVKGIKVQKLPQIRLHTQMIIRDRQQVFFGSQSLRKVELDERREVGLIIDHPEVVNDCFIIFELDWGDIID